jgi:hypothetical protein
LLLSRVASRHWAHPLAVLLFSAPFVWTLAGLALSRGGDDRAASLLALWPLLLILAAALALYELRRGPQLSVVLPAIVLGGINGTLLSQQLWGSTYAIWPLLIFLIAGMIAFAARRLPPASTLTLSTLVAAALLICGGFYVSSEERLSYADVLGGPAVHATLPQLRRMTAHGIYLPAFEELVRFANAEIPPGDGLILLPGEDPFYFVTGRTAQFPVLLFDPATDPLSPEQVVEEGRRLGIRWLVVKRKLQIDEDPTPNREATIDLLQKDFAIYRQLQNYDVYLRRQ